MNKQAIKNLIITFVSLTIFTLFTIALCFIDVQEIGPKQSSVGFSTVNKFFHELIGVYFPLYVITDWLGLIPVVFMFGFAILGFIQLICRKNILNVDFDLLVLGGFYILIFILYLFFEKHVVNFRPVLIYGHLEVSYPSSTTLLVACVMPTTLTQLKKRIKNKIIKKISIVFTICFIIFMIAGRLISGVHWFTDVLGGLFLSIGLVNFYKFLCNLKQ